MARTVKRFGWIPDLPDVRDHLYSAPRAALEALPPKVSLRRECPPVLDQGKLGSCTANAIASAKQSVTNALPDPVAGLRIEEWLFSQTLLDPLAIHRMERFMANGGQTREGELDLAASYERLQ